MSNFHILKTAVHIQFERLVDETLFVANVDKDLLWETYLGSFQEGKDPIFRERTEHDCQCCKQFIRSCGNVVAIIDNKLISIWDIQIDSHYQSCADVLSTLVKSQVIKDVFYHRQNLLGTDFNIQSFEDEKFIKWDHFHFNLPNRFVKDNDSIDTLLSEKRSNKDVFKRALVEISIEAVETVLELIEQKTIYKGEEFKSSVESFVKLKKEFDKIEETEKDNYCWVTSMDIGGASRIRNSVIGTLLVDVSDDVLGLDAAVKRYESKVAPTNYKRPTAVISKGMIKIAQEKIASLGITDSLKRRYAVTKDVTINNVLFANRLVQKEMNVFDVLKKEAPENIKKLKKIEDVSIQTFIDTILPKVDNVELMFENKHVNNLMSLIAPIDEKAKKIFKWDNNLSWNYNGEVTDSIKERVKKAGGNVSGILRCSISWFNKDDLDIHVIEPNGNHIYYCNAKVIQPSSGLLDVDMNADGTFVRNAVENVVWTSLRDMLEGKYKVYINNYTPRETTNIGFIVEIEYDKAIHQFHYNKRVTKDVVVAEFEFSRKGGIKFLETIPSTQASKDIWNIKTNVFHNTSMIMNSPNHWDGNKTGNKHYFFILENCKNKKEARGFFNEFLSEELTPHRKVFEVLGSKLKTEKSNEQLSGLGFSSTQKNDIICKLTGSFTRTIKLIF